MSINVGRPREAEWRGHAVLTGIWKEPVEGPVAVSFLNLAGDGQADLTVHGGVDKAVYAYPHEHYAGWATELGAADLPLGAFGENLTTEGLDERDVRIGDVFRIGSAELQVSQPRMPCFKLGIRFGRADMVKRFLRSGRSGLYLRVIREGALQRGDAIERLARSEDEPTVADIVALYRDDAGHEALLRRAVQSAALPESWRAYFRERLEGAAR